MDKLFLQHYQVSQYQPITKKEWSGLKENKERFQELDKTRLTKDERKEATRNIIKEYDNYVLDMEYTFLQDVEKHYQLDRFPRAVVNEVHNKIVVLSSKKDYAKRALLYFDYLWLLEKYKENT